MASGEVCTKQLNVFSTGGDTKTGVVFVDDYNDILSPQFLGDDRRLVERLTAVSRYVQSAIAFEYAVQDLSGRLHCRRSTTFGQDKNARDVHHGNHLPS